MKPFLIALVFISNAFSMPGLAADLSNELRQCLLTYEQSVAILNRNAPFFEQMSGVNGVFFGNFNELAGCSFSIEFGSKEAHENVLKIFPKGLELEGFKVKFVIR